MKTSTQIKNEVKKHYAQIAEAELEQVESCCAPSSKSNCACGPAEPAGDYSARDLRDVPESANLGLGCGNPVTFGQIREGDVVLDLGSGAGIDVFIAARQVGERGKVIGVDMTEAMIARARRNAEKVKAANVEFRLGEIEALPVEDGTIDMVISNCVINLVPSKEKAFAEVFRVLKTGGRFSVSDIVSDGTLSEKARQNAALWAGCVSGAIDRQQYLKIIRDAGFTDVRIVAERRGEEKLEDASFSSVTVTGRKP